VSNISISNSNNIVAIFGAGRTGLALAKELVKLEYSVDLYDIEDKNLELQKQIKFHKISTDSDLAKLQLQLEIERNGQNYESIFHTFLYTAADFENFINITGSFSQHFGTIGTVLTMDRTQDRGLLNENSPKLALENLCQNGGYAAGKRKLEIAIENWKIQNPNTKFFTADTFHIAGEGWVPGNSFPYFRNHTILDHIKTGQIWLPKAGDILHQIIDQRDLAKLIAQGITNKLHGGFIILNPKIITVAEYFDEIANIIMPDKTLVINELETNQVTDTLMMLLDWVCDIEKFQKAIGEEIKFQTHSETLEYSTRFLKHLLERHPEKKFQPSDIYTKMNVEPEPEIAQFNLEIQQARNPKLF